MVNFTKPRFTVGVGTSEFREGHARIFGEKPEKPDRCEAEHTVTSRDVRQCARDEGHKGRHKDLMGMTWASPKRKVGW
jgi:hypothetical protein